MPAPAPLATALQDRYRIERELGRGGMATVYLAHDLRHDRAVAIKVLHPELTAILGAERFLQEIRVTARLAHPHILPLLDSGEAAGFLYYVASYVEGESLRQRLSTKGPLSLSETVRITRGVAAALDSAHRRGIIHRDIKPENILLQDGEPLVADFGIALAVSALGRERLTETGLSLGTPAYMSPEQASADPRLDARSDQYSLASVVYEMLAGEPPYTGPTAQAIIAKRMTEPLPHLSAVREVPPAVEAALVKGLSRNPADRFTGTADFAQAIEMAAAQTHATTPTVAATVVTPSRHAPSRRVVALVSVVATLGVIAAMGWYLRPKAVSRAAAQRQLTFSGDANHAAISPDGKWLAFTSGDSVLLVREVMGGRAIPVLSGSYLFAPRWSKDGGSLLVHATLDSNFASDGLYEVPRLGGELRRIGQTGTYGGDYSPDGKSIVSATIDTVSISDRVTGRVIRQFTIPDVALIGGTIRWSPNGSWIAASGWFAGRPVIAMVTPEGRVADTTLGEAANAFAWDSRGSSLYIAKQVGSGTDLVKLAIDRKSGSQIAPALTVVSGLPFVSALDLSADGGALVMSRGGSTSHVWAATLDGPSASSRVALRQVTSGTRFNSAPAVSPDGRWLVWVESDGSTQSVLLTPFDGGAAKLIARYARELVEYPVWAPDSRQFGYFLTDSGRSSVLVTDVDGKQPTPVATVAKGLGPCWAWGPGFVVVWSSADSGFAVVDLASRARRVLPAPDSSLGMYGPVISRDGKELLAAEWRAMGEWNRLHTIRLDGGTWSPVKYDIAGDPMPVRWDAGGIFVDVTSSLGPSTLPARVWRAERPGLAFTPFLKPLQHCTASFEAAVSLSSNHRRAACTESRGLPDVWLVTDFDPDAR